MLVRLLMKCVLLTISTLSAGQAAPPGSPQRVFLSGHSLMDQPVPSNLAAVAESLGTPIQWNRQYMVGSSMRDRARGRRAPAAATGWEGYRQGYNKAGEGMDVLSEWRQPRTVSGPYDALVITEQHGLLGTLVWNDTVRFLRHHHDQFIAANPSGKTWFYESWLSLGNKDDPAPWIAYEKAASPIWQCLASRVNLSLQEEGRPDRIQAMATGWALAFLVEIATAPGGVPGVSGATVRETVDRIFKDNVHLTSLGSYYASLVTYAYLFDRSPEGGWAPSDLEPASASALQSVAWRAVSAERKSRRDLSVGDCQEELQGSFIALYWGYTRRAFWEAEVGTLGAWWRWAKHRIQWHWRLRRNGPDNPLRFDQATDGRFWLPPP